MLEVTAYCNPNHNFETLSNPTSTIFALPHILSHYKLSTFVCGIVCFCRILIE